MITSWLLHTTWSQAGLIILARTLSRSCLLRNWRRKINPNSWVCTQQHTLTTQHYIITHCPYLELDQHAFTTHTSRAPQVVDVFIFLVQLPSAHCFFTGAIVTLRHKLLTINIYPTFGCDQEQKHERELYFKHSWYTRQHRGGRTHPLVQSCSLEVLCVSWTRPVRGGCSCSCRWYSSWCRPTGRSPSGSPCSNSPSCSADVEEPTEKQQLVISISGTEMIVIQTKSCQRLQFQCCYCWAPTATVNVN